MLKAAEGRLTRPRSLNRKPSLPPPRRPSLLPGGRLPEALDGFGGWTDVENKCVPFKPIFVPLMDDGTIRKRLKRSDLNLNKSPTLPGVIL